VDIVRNICNFSLMGVSEIVIFNLYSNFITIASFVIELLEL
jgi:hypothetical protein